MRILVTGANGLLGQKLVELLQHVPGIHPIATARSNRSFQTDDIEFHLLDVEDEAQVADILKATQPDVVVHTAAMTQVDDCELNRDACWKANVTAVEHLIKNCELLNIHFIHISTDFIFDGSHGPLDESEQPSPVNYYGESKLAAEQLIQKSNLKWCILRTVLVYGITRDMSRSNIVLWVKKNLEEGKTIRVVNDQYRTPTLAEDLAMGCYLAAKHRAEGVYNISGKDFITPYDIAIKTANYFGLDSTLIQATDSTAFKQPAARPLITGFVIDKARKDLGYEPHSFDEGIAVLAGQIA